MQGYHKVKIISNQPAAENQVFLTLEVPPEVLRAHIQPGQFTRIALSQMEPWSATIANRPGRDNFEFLVKDVGPRSHRISQFQPGDELLMSLPEGEGFPINAYRRTDIILMASGVAICAMRSIIEEILLQRLEWDDVHLFYGERHSERFAFIDEQVQWRESGIEVHLCASQPSTGSHWAGLVGYVQDYIRDFVTDFRNCAAFIAGPDDMVEDCVNELDRLGLPESKVFLNL
ncbi:MAG: hypothetical protein ABIC40_03625 [bacterium]